MAARPHKGPMAAVEGMPVKSRRELHEGPGKEELPESLQEADTEDTSCKWCGVSYLVFSEVKEMERQLAETRATAAKWQRQSDAFEEMEAKHAKEVSLRRAAEAALDSMRLELERQSKSHQQELAEAEASWRAKALEARQRDEERHKGAIASLEERLAAKLRQQELVGRGSSLRLRDLASGLSETRRLLKKEKENLEAVRSELDFGRRDVANLVSAVTSEVEAIRTQVDRRSKAATKASGEVVEARERAKRAERELTSLKAELRLANEARGKLQSAFEASEAAAADAARAAAAERSELASQLAAVEAEVAKLRAAEERAVATATRHKTAADGLEQELSRLKDTARSGAAAAGAAGERARQAAAELTEVRRELEIEGQRAESYHTTCEKLKAELAKARSALSLAKEEAAREVAAKQLAASDAAASASDRLRKMQEQVEELMDEVSSLREERSGHQAELVRVKSELTRDTEEKVKVETKRADEAESATRRAHAELEREKKLLSKSASELEACQSRLKELERQASRSTSQVGELRQQVSAMHEEIAALQTRLRVAETNQVNARQAAEEAERDVAAARGEVEQLRSELADARTARAAAEGLEEMERRLITAAEESRRQQQEIKVLKQTVHHECEERTAILTQLAALQMQFGLPVGVAKGHDGSAATVHHAPVGHPGPADMEALRSSARSPTPVKAAPPAPGGATGERATTRVSQDVVWTIGRGRGRGRSSGRGRARGRFR